MLHPAFAVVVQGHSKSIWFELVMLSCASVSWVVEHLQTCKWTKASQGPVLRSCKSKADDGLHEGDVDEVGVAQRKHNFKTT